MKFTKKELKKLDKKFIIGTDANIDECLLNGYIALFSSKNSKPLILKSFYREHLNGYFLVGRIYSEPKKLAKELLNDLTKEDIKGLADFVGLSIKDLKMQVKNAPISFIGDFDACFGGVFGDPLELKKEELINLILS